MRDWDHECEAAEQEKYLGDESLLLAELCDLDVSANICRPRSLALGADVVSSRNDLASSGSKLSAASSRRGEIAAAKRKGAQVALVARNLCQERRVSRTLAWLE
ncbi:hypothetical protein Tco_0437904 [Tanacetum coccineum]